MFNTQIVSFVNRNKILFDSWKDGRVSYFLYKTEMNVEDLRSSSSYSRNCKRELFIYNNIFLV